MYNGSNGRTNPFLRTSSIPIVSKIVRVVLAAYICGGQGCFWVGLPVICVRHHKRLVIKQMLFDKESQITISPTTTIPTTSGTTFLSEDISVIIYYLALSERKAEMTALLVHTDANDALELFRVTGRVDLQHHWCLVRTVARNSSDPIRPSALSREAVEHMQIRAPLAAGPHR